MSKVLRKKRENKELDDYYQIHEEYRTKDGPRPMTPDEVRDVFLRQVWTYVQYWDEESRRPTPREKLEGMAFSLLAMLDGSNINMPGWRVEPNPHETDKEYAEKELECNWFPEKDCDIGGSLHELFYNVGRENGYVKDEKEEGGS